MDVQFLLGDPQAGLAEAEDGATPTEKECPCDPSHTHTPPKSNTLFSSLLSAKEEAKEDTWSCLDTGIQLRVEHESVTGQETVGELKLHRGVGHQVQLGGGHDVQSATSLSKVEEKSDQKKRLSAHEPHRIQKGERAECHRPCSCC